MPMARIPPPVPPRNEAERQVDLAWHRDQRLIDRLATVIADKIRRR